MRLEKRVNLIYKSYQVQGKLKKDTKKLLQKASEAKLRKSGNFLHPLEISKKFQRDTEKEASKMTKGKKLFIFDAGDRAFWTAEGHTIKNLYQLSAAFERMSDETFKHHVNEAKNDFCTWVYDVFGEKRLAKKLTNARTKQEAQIAVLKHLVSVSSK